MGDAPDQLLSVSEAQTRLLSFFTPHNCEEISLSTAPGRVLAQDLHAQFDLPAFPNSSMDGFAVVAVDTAGAGNENPVTLKVVMDIPAGKIAAASLHSGQAARIMTGAPLPGGADAVIPVEATDFHQRQAGVSAPSEVRLFRPVKAGDYVRPAGEDVRAGETILEKGRRLQPADIGFLSMAGFSPICVYPSPKVAVFSTGDELLPVELPLTPGKIHDANSLMLSAAIESLGCQVVPLGIVPDREDEVREALERATASQVDLILSSAGVSVGAFDFVRSVVERFGQLGFWRVNMRPGKPLAFGHYRDIPFIGLPGNPVSAFVGFEVFVRPALCRLSGWTEWLRQSVPVRLAEPIDSDGRESYLRAIISTPGGQPTAHLTGHQGSGNLRSLAQANALLIIPAGVRSLPEGAVVNAWMLRTQ